MAADPTRVEDLYLRTLEITDPALRESFLDRECGADAPLRQRVEALLRGGEKPGQRPKAAAAELAQTVDSDAGPITAAMSAGSPAKEFPTIDSSASLSEGAVIAGRYVLERKIGEGGMGEVWAARQTEPIKRRLALKLIKAGMDSKSVLARFNAERQALALMDHPHIAKVLDAGLTSTGQPFFAMELVSGLPLNKFCDEARLGIRDRLALFVPICQAVQHAHQKGIVHRDLKPANILVATVDGKPAPKVIDFGVAKATSGSLTDESLATQFGAVVGTLEYMAPEQAGMTGEDVDTRADIYSLGVILYEMLTGLRPIDAKRLRKAALTEMIRIIREEEPSKPSTRLSTDESLASTAAVRRMEPSRLMALLRGELDWVVMKCLEKQRDRRYETASSLARDVERYLADEPVEARPPSAGYRLRKFLRRHRGAVVAASLLAFVAMVGSIGVVWQWREALIQRRHVEVAKEEAENNLRIAQQQRKVALDAVGRMVTTVRTELMKKPDLQGVLKKVLEIAQGSLDEIAQNPLVTISLNDTTRAAAHDAAARLYRDLGDTPTALKELSKAADIYHAILEKAADGPDKDVVKKNLMIVQISLGQTSLRTGSQAESRAYFEQAAGMLSRLDDKTAADFRKILFQLFLNLGVVTIDARPREAREDYLRALRVAQEMAESETAEKGQPSDGTRLALQQSYSALANSEGRLRNAKANEEYNDKARAIASERLKAQPTDDSRKKLLAHQLERIGDSRLRAHDPSAAATQYIVAAALLKDIANTDPKNVDAQADHARILYSQGLAAARLGDQAAAANCFARSLDIRKSRVNLNTETYARKDLMMSLAHVGNHRNAAAMAEAIRTKLPKDAGTLVDVANCYAVCSNVVPATGTEKETHDRYVSKALEALRQAIEAGYGDKVNLETEPDLDAVRQHVQFKTLLERMPEP